MSLSKCAFFLFSTFLFLFSTFHSGAQGLTKYGESFSGVSTNYVDKNGQLVNSPALGRYGGTPVSVAIGDNYGGGKVAYILQSGDPGYDAYAQHGLIAAPNNQSTGGWGCKGTAISGADGTAIGTGNQNTIDIMTGCATAGIAARLCGDLVLGGYSDWYLPSRDELNKLYLNRVAIGGFVTDLYYQSSSESGNDFNIKQDFSDGTPYSWWKDFAYNVRAVRSF